jgi:hypothetical protein
MDHRQRELRRAAAQDFLESLHQLEHTFTPTEPAPPVRRPEPVEDPLEDLEDAAADIERFLQDLSSDPQD